MVDERHLRLNHPELDQMAASLRFLRTERRPERIYLAERHRRSFHIQLAALRQIRIFIEIFGMEQIRRPFAGGRRQDRRIHQREAAFVEELLDRTDNFRANDQNGPLLRGPQPQMTAVHQVIDAMLLGRDGIILRRSG